MNHLTHQLDLWQFERYKNLAHEAGLQSTNPHGVFNKPLREIEKSPQNERMPQTQCSSRLAQEYGRVSPRVCVCLILLKTLENHWSVNDLGSFQEYRVSYS